MSQSPNATAHHRHIQSNSGTSMQALLYPVAPRPSSVDHIGKNRRQILDIQRRVGLEKLQAESNKNSLDAHKKMARFSHIQPRVHLPASPLSTTPTNVEEKTSETSAGGNYRHGEFGKAPTYLRRIKQQIESEKPVKKPALTPGLRLVGEEERVEMVKKLKQALSTAEAELSLFPLIVDTVHRIARKRQLEERVRELDSALSLFNKKVVYIADSSAKK